MAKTHFFDPKEDDGKFGKTIASAVTKHVLMDILSQFSNQMDSDGIGTST